MIFDNSLMKEALEQANLALLTADVPVGAVIFDNKSKQLIGHGYNKVECLKNVTYHAEIIALTQASQFLQSKTLEHCDAYITLEPCAMCLVALSSARIRRIYYGAVDSKFGAIEGATNLFAQIPTLYKPETYGGILAEESAVLLRSFFKQLR